MNQDEYFSVHAGLTINVEPLPEHFELPDDPTFIREIPPLFRVASECSELEHNAEKALQQESKSMNRTLLDYLAAQNHKMNLLLSFVLAQQDDPAFRQITQTFGASQLTYLSQQPMTAGSQVRLKLFLENPPAAVYCYASVQNCQPAGDDTFEVTLHYSRLQEEDRDLLIRAALHIQQKLLRQRAMQRNDNQ
ncbi:PilZ domain-containing protein [Photobacterium galatheae]|uniref:PilZ domain-containing protein n=1 Tax=Photobacterium galatheae TaxID=1654360 RepID=UPI00202CDAB3|nr:PilZ domain-containing protein [Photobacterium galatheae]MCM0147162.1 PilZ domain-containing protein [Photobacterium galatheae]